MLKISYFWRMKDINYRFILSNLVTAVILFFSIPYYKSDYERFHEQGGSPVYGSIVLILVICGMMASVVKTHNLSFGAKYKLKWHERPLLILLYIGAFIANMFLIGTGHGLVFGRRAMFLIMLLLIAGFVLLILEIHFLQHRPRKILFPKWKKHIDFAANLYSGIGISLCWNHTVLADRINFGGFYQALFFHCIMMIVFVFSFQRLFWYELFTDSNSRSDHRKLYGAICFTLLCGILPLYFLNELN